MNEVVHTAPTIGSNVEEIVLRNTHFLMWDIGGQETLRATWNSYYSNTEVRISRSLILNLQSAKEVKSTLVLTFFFFFKFELHVWSEFTWVQLGIISHTWTYVDADNSCSSLLQWLPPSSRSCAKWHPLCTQTTGGHQLGTAAIQIMKLLVKINFRERETIIFIGNLSKRGYKAVMVTV